MLSAFFNPRNIAIIGASERKETVGFRISRNLLESAYSGHLFFVNPNHKELFGRNCYHQVAAISDAVDLAIIATSSALVSEELIACGKKGIRSVIIISAGFSETGTDGKKREETIAAIANQYQIRYLGPNCLGLMRPNNHLNASFDENTALPGQVALLSQSGAICAGILDWALPKHIGFSALVSMGNSSNIDFGDLLQFFAEDPETKSILLYIEGIHNTEGFLKGLYAASSKKPVIVLKAGRKPTGVRAVHSHTGALVGDDQVFEAALNRGGAVRVDTIEDLFIAAEILSRTRHKTAVSALGIITNGGGAGVMAADAADEYSLPLGMMSDTFAAALSTVLPPFWSKQNPIDIIGDATPKRYRDTLQLALQSDCLDALLVILVPVAMADPLATAQVIVEVADNSDKMIIACFMGGAHTAKAKEYLVTHQIPCYDTPEAAIKALYYLSQHATHQQFLKASALFSALSYPIDRLIIDSLINQYQQSGANILSMHDSKAILQAANIPTIAAINAASQDEASVAAEKIGFPVAMKINAKNITHKQDVGGVILNLHNKEEVYRAYDDMMTRVIAASPNADIDGVTLEAYLERDQYRELFIGVTHDPVFGPVIAFGAGGTLIEIMNDKAVQLIPLNPLLAEALINQTHIAKTLDAFRGKQAINKKVIIDVLLRISNLVLTTPAIKELDINPLLINADGCYAVDARIVLHSLTA